MPTTLGDNSLVLLRRTLVSTLALLVLDVVMFHIGHELVTAFPATFVGDNVWSSLFVLWPSFLVLFNLEAVLPIGKLMTGILRELANPVGFVWVQSVFILP